MANEKGKPYPDLLHHLEDKDKQMFGAYVDVLPLKVSAIMSYICLIIYSYRLLMI